MSVNDNSGDYSDGFDGINDDLTADVPEIKFGGDLSSGDDYLSSTEEQIHRMLQSMTYLSEHQREELRDNLLTPPIGDDRDRSYVNWIVGFLVTLTLYAVVVTFLVAILLASAFFGYRLYKSLTERQRKREEKLKAKNSRKKK